MSKSGITPGPWAVEDRTRVGAGFSVIATDVHYSCSGVAHYVGEADARLIAAAPDLLEALQTLDALWRENESDTLAFSLAVGRAQTAIAKATGNAD